MTTFNKHAGGSRFTGAFASTGGTLGREYKTPTWRVRTCSVCGAVPQERCFRWVTERVTQGKQIIQGEGRKSYLKNPHPERKK